MARTVARLARRRSRQLRARLARPVEGVLFDVEHAGFWYDEWGLPRPDVRDEALTIARAALADVPAMVPVFGHRFLPSGRGSVGHPVLSIHQTDVIYYGLDLPDWGEPRVRRSQPEAHRPGVESPGDGPILARSALTPELL